MGFLVKKRNVFLGKQYWNLILKFNFDQHNKVHKPHFSG